MTRPELLAALQTRPIDAYALTAYGEARNQKIRAVVGVINVMVNRLLTKHWGTTAADVVLAPSQFSCWNPNDPNYQILVAMTVGEVYDDCVFDVMRFLAERAVQGRLPDLTRGALHYFNPHAVRIVPAWACAPAHRTVILGDHEFWTGVAY